MRRIKYSVILITVTAALLTGSSCGRNKQNATITVDTVETANVDTLPAMRMEAVFEGVLPCADCEGILTNLKLDYDSMSYFLTETYRGMNINDSAFMRSGVFEQIAPADSLSTIIKLSAAKEAAPLYFKQLGDTVLLKLDQEGKEFDGNLNYSLRRK